MPSPFEMPSAVTRPAPWCGRSGSGRRCSVLERFIKGTPFHGCPPQNTQRVSPGAQHGCYANLSGTTRQQRATKPGMLHTSHNSRGNQSRSSPHGHLSTVACAAVFDRMTPSFSSMSLALRLSNPEPSLFSFCPFVCISCRAFPRCTMRLPSSGRLVLSHHFE